MNNTDIYVKAMQLGSCNKLTGKENLSELLSLFFTPQGLEFCSRHNFPNLDHWRANKGDVIKQRGFFVDENINIHNADKIVLVGNTIAELTYTDNSKLHTVVVMHGAKAIIKAYGYAVVAVTNISGDIEIHQNDNSIIL